MNWTRGILALGGVAAVFVVVACSSSSSSSEGDTGEDQGPVTSVNKDKQLNQLSDEEAQTYCLDTNKYIRASITAEISKGSRCNYRGIMRGHDEATADAAKKACSEVRTACKAEAPPDAGPVDAGADDKAQAACKVFKSKIVKCNSLTVGNSNGCWAEFVKRSKAFSASDACVDVTPDSPEDPVAENISTECSAWEECVMNQ